MKDDTISRQAAIEEIRRTYEYEFPTASGAFDEFVTQIVPNVLRNLPAAEPRKGKWVCEIRHYKDTAGEFDYQYIYCSECGEQRRIGWQDANYCPYCGARMEESE